MARTMTAHEAALMLERFQFGEVAARTTDRVRPGLVAAMRARAPYDDSEYRKTDEKHLRDTIFAERHTSLDGAQLLVETSSGHAGYVLDGTKPHDIPSGGVTSGMERGYPLVFFWARVGAVVKTFGWHGTPWGYTKHPGSKPNRFPELAWAETRVGVVEALKTTALEQLFKGKL